MDGKENWTAAELEAWSKELDEVEAVILPYWHRVARKWNHGSWESEPTVEERRFRNLWYFYQAAVLNEGSVVDFIDFMISQRDDLVAIGAHGCLAALDSLLPFHAEQQRIANENGRSEYWRHQIAAREAADKQVEDAICFGRLLIDYARKNSDRIG